MKIRYNKWYATKIKKSRATNNNIGIINIQNINHHSVLNMRRKIEFQAARVMKT